MILSKEQHNNWQDTLVNSYNTSMVIAQGVAEQEQTLTDTDKKCIMASVGALLEAVGIATFNGVYTIEDLKSDISKIKGE